MIENRLWIVVTPAGSGGASIRFTMTQPPAPTGVIGVVRVRGMIAEDAVITIPAQPKDGKDATPEQIAAAVAHYLTDHPPAPGRPPTEAEIAAAVSAWQIAHPVVVPIKAEFTASLIDAYAAGLSAGGFEKRLACAGLKTTDTVIVQPTAALPVGYQIGSASCTENGWVRVGAVRPLLAVGASNTIPLRVTAFR